MSKVLAILAVAAMCIASGCERNSEEPVEETQFDPTLDGPPSMLDRPISDEVAEDQTAIAQKARQAAGEAALPAALPAGRPAAAPALTGTPVEQVTQTVGMMLAAAKPGQEQQMLAFFGQQEAAALLPMIQGAAQLPIKMQRLEKLATDKLGMSLPQDLKQGTSMAAGGMPINATMKPEDFTFEQSGQDVLAKDPTGKEVRFTKVGGRWLIKLDPDEMEALSVVAELMAGTEKAVDEMTVGINDGSIDKANFDAKAKAIGEKHMGPVMKKFMELMMKGMGPATAPAVEPDSSL